jgi:hypothetical protein
VLLGVMTKADVTSPETVTVPNSFVQLKVAPTGSINPAQTNWPCGTVVHSGKYPDLPLRQAEVMMGIDRSGLRGSEPVGGAEPHGILAIHGLN